MRANAQPLLRRLQLLYHHGYLERPRAQLEYYHHGGSRPIVYGLGGKGAVLMKPEPGVELPNFRWGEKNRGVGRMFLEHALLVSEVMVTLELACRESGAVRLITEDELRREKNSNSATRFDRWNVTLEGRKKLGVEPDRIFALEFQQPNGSRERILHFLEADRGTMPVKRSDFAQTSFFRKLLAYEATWSQSIHQKRFGFHRFRVLTVTTIPERVQSLVNACAELKRGHGLFLFTDRASLLKPGALFSSIWQTSRPGVTETLLK